MSTDRPYDVVLLGATGFTGRLVADYLATRLAGTDVTWAIAGRRGDALSALRDELAAAAPSPVPAVEVVDAGDLVGLLDLAARTRVLASTAGPFERLGELGAQACVRSGTHYCDTTGEPAYVQHLQSRYHRDAERRGVRLVPACAFESVPHDLGARLAAQQLPQHAPIRVRGYVAIAAAPSAGTLRTALEARSPGRPPRRPAPDPDALRPVGALPRTIHYVDELGRWALPLPSLDERIVMRSAQLLDGYGTVFRYGHYLRVGGPLSAAGRLAAGTGAGVARFPPARALLRRLLPPAGTGPSPERRARSWFTVNFFGESGGAQPEARSHVRVAGGDPAYGGSARMLAEAALALAHDAPVPRAGVLTPASGLGEGYLERLRGAGLRFDVRSAPGVGRAGAAPVTGRRSGAQHGGSS